MGTDYPGDYDKSLAPGSGCLLNVVYDIAAEAPGASTTDLDLTDDLGIPPRQNRFFGNDGSVISPTLEDGSLTTIYVWESDFEADGGGLIAYGEWEYGEDPWSSGNHLWGTDLDGYYEPSSCYGLYGQFEVRDDFETAYMTFQHKYNVDPGKSHGDDGGNVQGALPVLPGAWEVLDPDWIAYDVDSLFNTCLTYQPAYSGRSVGWSNTVRAAFDISGHISALHGLHTIYYNVRWMFSSDQWPTVSDGWFMDDLRVMAAPPEAGPFFIRGDVNKDGIINIIDITSLANYVLYGNPVPPAPCDRADANDDGVVDIDDVVYLTSFLGGGPAPVWPYPNPGIDSSPDDLPLECASKMLSSGREPVSPSDPQKLSFEVFQNTPNPFETATEIRYDLPRAGQVKIEVFNSLGQKVATVVDEYRTAGHKAEQWDAGALPSGVYFYRLQTEGAEATRKMTLLK